MPFIQLPEQLKPKAQLGKMSLPTLIGVVSLVLVILAFAAGGLISALSDGSFEIEKVNSGSANTLDQYNATNSQITDGTSENANAGTGVEKVAGKSGGGSSKSDRVNEETGSSVLIVYVCGAVNDPGVYKFPEGSRIEDAVERAGGFNSDAATEALNLAQELQDEQQVLVPTVDEYRSSSTLPSTEGVNTQGNNSKTGNSSGLVNINTAGTGELVTLPGVGEATAAKIISSRESEGAFQTIDDLKRVSGIGDKKFEAIKDLICV